MLALAVSFRPVMAPLPVWAARSSWWVSTRFARDGTATGVGGQVIGINGTTSNYLPVRSPAECIKWGAAGSLWCYVDLATAGGFASPAQFAAEFAAAGLRLQGSVNTRAVNPSTGPFAFDAGGFAFSASGASPRPTLVSGNQNPVNSRSATAQDSMPGGDATNSRAPKIAAASSQMALGCFGLQIDTPRGAAELNVDNGITFDLDSTSQGADFSVTGQAGFTTWLLANTTDADRSAVGMTGWNTASRILDWLKANKPLLMFANPPSLQVDPTAVDNYIFRTTLRNDRAVRQIIGRWMAQFLQQDNAIYLAGLRSAVGSGLFSANIYAASPSMLRTGFSRAAPGVLDFAIAETQPPYWSELLAHAVGSLAWTDARMVQCARNRLHADTMDMLGLHAFFEHKPTAPNQAPARVLKQLLRQSMLQTVMDGHTPMAPVDVYMDGSDARDQGVVGLYRFWAQPADYSDIGAFTTGDIDETSRSNV